MYLSSGLYISIYLHVMYTCLLGAISPSLLSLSPPHPHTHGESISLLGAISPYFTLSLPPSPHALFFSPPRYRRVNSKDRD